MHFIEFEFTVRQIAELSLIFLYLSRIGDQKTEHHFLHESHIYFKQWIIWVESSSSLLRYYNYKYVTSFCQICVMQTKVPSAMCNCCNVGAWNPIFIRSMYSWVRSMGPGVSKWVSEWVQHIDETNNSCGKNSQTRGAVPYSHYFFKVVPKVMIIFLNTKNVP